MSRLEHGLLLDVARSIGKKTNGYSLTLGFVQLQCASDGVDCRLRRISTCNEQFVLGQDRSGQDLYGRYYRIGTRHLRETLRGRGYGVAEAARNGHASEST